LGLSELYEAEGTRENDADRFYSKNSGIKELRDCVIRNSSIPKFGNYYEI
jgi:hypothetical protein